jgi:inhibitor of KinA
LNESAVAVQMAEAPSESVMEAIASCCAYIRAHPIAGCVSVVPAYTTVTFYFDRYADGSARGLTVKAMTARVEERLREWAASEADREKAGFPPDAPAAQGQAARRKARVIDIPVRYGGADGPDLTEVAEHCGLTPEEVVRIHCSALYTVHMIGFMPGFPYLGGLDPRIAAPRKAEPRMRVPAGSVGIAGRQTGIYPLESPGGWQLIGRTDIRLFDPRRDPPALLRIGDRVRFVEVAGP